MWAMTGMPAPTIARMASAIWLPPWLHCLGAGFFQEPSGVAHCVSLVCLIGQERHVARYYNYGRHCPARYHFRVVDHLVHCDRQRARYALHYHAEGIPDEGSC